MSIKRGEGVAPALGRQPQALLHDLPQCVPRPWAPACALSLQRSLRQEAHLMLRIQDDSAEGAAESKPTTLKARISHVQMSVLDIFATHPGAQAAGWLRRMLRTLPHQCLPDNLHITCKWKWKRSTYVKKMPASLILLLHRSAFCLLMAPRGSGIARIVLQIILHVLGRLRKAHAKVTFAAIEKALFARDIFATGIAFVASAFPLRRLQEANQSCASISLLLLQGMPRR